METTTTTTKTIATMTSEELAEHIATVDFTHKVRMRTLRALLRALQAEEGAKE